MTRGCSAAGLRQEWRELLGRRPALAGSLAVYEAVLAAWAGADARVAPLGWTAAECLDRWQRGVPLLAETLPALRGDVLDALVGPALSLLATVRPDACAALARFAAAWDGGAIGVRALLASGGRWRPLPDGDGLASPLVAFVACAALRPVLEPYLDPCRAWLTDAAWRRGACPFCGAPPGLAAIVDGGARRLACHLCGGSWTFARVACPFCGTEEARDLTRLDAQGEEEGYGIVGCGRCRQYVKELDRRKRWRTGAALVEDWGSPHLDLIARRAGYSRPIPSLIDLASRS